MRHKFHYFPSPFILLVVLCGCSSSSELTRTADSDAAVAAPVGTNDESESADTPDDPRDLRGVVTAAATASLLNVYFGLLHAHTFFSDGSGQPTDAYSQAKSKGVEFFAVTPHNHKAAESSAGERKDGVLIATNPKLYNSEDPIQITRQWSDGTTESLTVSSVITSANAATSSEFQGLFGQEFSTISSGNHLNVLWWEEVLTVPNGKCDDLFAAFDAAVASGVRIPVVQLNHPDVREDLFRDSTDENEKSNDYGFDDYGSNCSALVAAADKYIDLIELLSGPAMTKESHAEYHYGSDDFEPDYYFYLMQGFHISPSVGHDNHYETWGDATPARMGVLATELTDSALYAATRGNATFATEDSDLRVELLINGQSMGGDVNVASGTKLEITLRVSDPTDSSNEYEAVLVHGVVDPQDGASLVWVDAADGKIEKVIFDDTSVRFADQSASGDAEFYYVRVSQKGDGDRAWTGPVWINHPRT